MVSGPARLFHHFYLFTIVLASRDRSESEWVNDTLATIVLLALHLQQRAC
jgi:hypothetical protein